MKSIVEIGGTVTHSKITVYLPIKLFSHDENTYQLPIGYNYLLSVSGDTFHSDDIEIGKSRDDDAFVFITTNNVKAVINPTCNVNYEIYRFYSATQWLMYGFICASRYIKNKFNKYIGNRK